MIAKDILRTADIFGFRLRWAVTILGLQLASVVFEGVGLGMFLPVLQFMNSAGDIAALTGESLLWQRLLDVFDAVGLPLNLATLLGVAFFFFTCRQIFVYVRLVYTAKIQFEVVRRTRDLGFQRFLRADFAYHDNIRSGDIVNEMTTELAAVVGWLIAVMSLIGYVILGLAYMAVLLALSVPMTLAALGVFAVTAWSLRRILEKTREAGIRLTNANQRMSSFLVQRLKAVRLVRLSGVEKAEIQAMEYLNRDQREQVVSILLLKAILSVSVEPIVLSVSMVLLYFAVSSLVMDFELILLFFLILLRLVPVIKEILMVRQTISGGLASVEIVERRLSELEAARDVKGGSRQFVGLRQSIRFERATFSYGVNDVTMPAISDVTLEIPAAKVTALVGPSGAGKSTLVDLLPRLRHIQSGRILFDGVDQEEFDVVSLRHGIAFAPQTPQIFDVSISEHIRYGLSSATPEQVASAAQLAQAAEFIERLPDGYDTRVGEGAALLSGGQRQRLDLARALVSRAPILILDEPTSNLDAESEALFRQALRHIREETRMTLIIIGHRLSTIADADQIVILDNGRVTARGSHDELRKSSKWYARAWASQTRSAQRDEFTSPIMVTEA